MYNDPNGHHAHLQSWIKTKNAYFALEEIFLEGVSWEGSVLVTSFLVIVGRGWEISSLGSVCEIWIGTCDFFFLIPVI